MQILRCLNYFILILILKASAKPKYYFEKEDVETIVDDIYSETGNIIRRIVVDFGSTYYLSKLITNETENHPNVFAIYYGAIRSKIKICSLNKAHHCNVVTRIAIIEGQGVKHKYDFEGHYTYAENYTGCYSTNLDTVTMKEISIETCQRICRSESFYGISQTRCLCINDTSKLMLVNLELCRSSCPLSFQHCGSNIYFSLYSMERYIKFKDPSWECVFRELNCPTCPGGRRGKSCEHIDCLINNGNCEELSCQAINYGNYPNVGMCICEKGFYYDRTFKCKDIDECLALPCGADSSCVNSIGSFSCICHEGFDDIKGSCVDHDECSANPCGANMNCLNSPGTYSCSCQTGFLLKDSICEDIDECKSITCGLHQDCQNTHGSYICNCIQGFYRIDATSCADIDECKTMETCDKISTFCKNLDGDYECICKFGFDRLESDSPKSGCRDVDECTLSESCDESTTNCENLLGDYECLCKEGYTRMEFKSRKSQCQDEDECSQEDKCPSGVICLNLIGSYECVCPNGTKKQMSTHTIECEDIDECENPDICDQTTSFCLNTVRSYVCSCRPGYVPINNYTCVQVAKENTTSRWEDNYSTEVYDEDYDDNFEEFYTYAFSFFFVVIIGATFLSFLWRVKTAPSSRVSSLSSVSN